MITIDDLEYQLERNMAFGLHGHIYKVKGHGCSWWTLRRSDNRTPELDREAVDAINEKSGEELEAVPEEPGIYEHINNAIEALEIAMAHCRELMAMLDRDRE